MDRNRRQYGFSSSLLLKTFFIMFLALGLSCSTARKLRIQPAEPQTLQGSYKLLLFGCRHPDDIENLVILDKEGDNAAFDVYAPSFEYKVKGSIEGEAALREAVQFLKCSFFYEQSQLSMISDASGKLIGYELRPLYSAVRFGKRDVFDVQYQKKGDKVLTFIRLDPEVERFIQSPGNDDRHERR